MSSAPTLFLAESTTEGMRCSSWVSQSAQVLATLSGHSARAQMRSCWRDSMRLPSSRNVCDFS